MFTEWVGYRTIPETIAEKPGNEKVRYAMLLTDNDKLEFAERGYIVVPAVLSRPEIDAATGVIDDLIAETPPPDGHRGHHFYWAALEPGHPLLRLVRDGTALDVAEQLIRPGRLEVPRQAQIALNIPPHPHRPGRGHLDGATPPEPDGRPGTFTVLAGLMLTDQTLENAGNLWVWPGTHRTHEAYFRERGPDALLPARGLPDITLPAPEQVLGRAGDLLLAHYMLGHNIGGNTSPNVRRGGLLPFATRRAPRPVARLSSGRLARVRRDSRGAGTPRSVTGPERQRRR